MSLGGGRKQQQCFISLKEIPPLTSKSSGLNISFIFIPIGHDGAAKSDALRERCGKNEQMTSYKMCLSQLMSNKCTILMEKY